MSPEVLQDTYGHHHPDHLQGAAEAIGQKRRYVSVAESVVDLEPSTRSEGKKPNDYLVGVAGFEPATPASRTQCSTGLSHTPTKNAAYSLGFRRPQEAELRKLIPVNVGLKTQILPAGEAAVAAAARILAAGGLVAFPTETVYGLGADAANPAAIARLYQAKGRPAFNPLIAHVGDLAAARQIARFDAAATRAGRGVLAGAADVGAAENGGLRGGRPRHRRPRHRRDPDAGARGGAGNPARLRRPGGGAVGQSARATSRRPPPHMSQSDLAGKIDLIVDGGPVEVGVESTIVGCFDAADAAASRRRAARGHRARARPRAGATTRGGGGDSAQPLAPGMLASHYAPRTRVRLNAISIAPGEALLAFGLAPIARSR